MTKALVTGASGFVGSHLCRRLCQRGYQVKALIRQTSSLERLRELDIDLAYGDLRDIFSLHSALKGMEIVFHTAASVGDWVKKEEAYAVNVKGTENILKASLSASVRRFIGISSLAVLGMKDHYGTKETAPYESTGDAYCDSKIESEKLMLEFGKKYNLPVTILRPGFIYGPGDNQLLPRILDTLKKGKFAFIGRGDKILNIVYIENLIEAIILAAGTDRAIGQVYNITDGAVVDRRKFINTIADIWGVPRPHREIPIWLAKALTPIFENVNRFTGSKRPPLLNRARMKFMALNLHFDISKAKEELGYRPVFNLRQALEETHRQFRK